MTRSAKVLLVFFFISALPLFQSLPVKSKTKELKLEYKLKLGWFTIGGGTVSIAENAMTINNRRHDEINIHMTTLGLGNWLGSLDDDYRSILDAKTSRSYYTYKDVMVSGNKHWEQWSSFNYDSLEVDVKVKDYRRENPDRNWQVKISSITYDILGTFHFFKNMDLSKAKLNDSTLIDTFYETKLYPVGVKYMGLEKIDFEGEEVEAHTLHLLLPDHENLKKDKPVIIWMSKDKNHIPIRIQTKLGIGHARCELSTINDEEALPQLRSFR